MKKETKKKIKERIDEVADENGSMPFDQFLGLAKEFIDVDPHKTDDAIAYFKNIGNDTESIGPISDGEEVNDDLPF